MDDQKFSRIEDKLDRIDAKIGNIHVTLSAQQAILAEHVRRSTTLEQQMEPIKTHVAMVNGGLKLVGLLALIVALIEGALKLVRN